MFLFDLVNLLDLLDRQVPLAYHQDGLQIYHLLVIEKGWEPEIHRVSSVPCDLHHPSINLIHFQWVMATTISHHRKRDNGNGPDRVIEYTLTYKCHRYRKFNLWLLHNLMMYQMRTLQLWIPHHYQLDHHHQLNREVTPEETKDLDRVREYLHIHPRMPASSHRWRSSNRGSTKSRERPLKVTTRTRRLTETGSTHTEGKENCCRKAAEWITEGQKSTSSWIQMRMMKDLKTSLVPFQTLNLLYEYFLILKDQQQILKDQLSLTTLRMKTVSIAMHIMHKVRTPNGLCSTQISSFWLMMNIGQWRRRHKFAAAAGSFCCETTENWDQQDIRNLTTMPFVQRFLFLVKATNDSGNIKVEVPKGVGGRTRDMLERYMATWGKNSKNKSKHEIPCTQGSISSRGTRILQTVCWSKTSGVQILVDNEVFNPVDLRKIKPKNYVTGRWVLTIKTDKQGNFLKAKARWVLGGFQNKQKEYQETDSPASTRTGFRMSCQTAASKSWNIFDIDLKTAFLQGQSYCVNRDVVC